MVVKDRVSLPCLICPLNDEAYSALEEARLDEYSAPELEPDCPVGLAVWLIKGYFDQTNNSKIIKPNAA